ncbi:acyl-CoA dehydrogenase family protein [Oricola cellulosilytica]|uniref:Pimeloyl-CoA dehydrogenase small subunit n=1 Tax=Oricola cellulosilytica TaxID=1429082 RepID=A0A4R0P9Y0_9HYPH|nr:acyl-CoA dehydrogenase family protein [Oricola cellulosilytica]TCD13735.1 pimeloyl-CoA dehydrogenase small subunit [Oricola cellulosilytica]
MDFSLTDEQRMLKDTLARFVADNYGIEVRHEIAASPEGFSRDIWSQFAELGIIGALFAEADGGFGGGGFDLSTVFEEIGRGLVVEPLLASVLGGNAIASLGDEAQKARLEGVIAGETIVALAHGEPQSRYDHVHVETRAERDGDGWRLNGEKAVVLNGDSAGTLVVSARTGGEVWDEEGISLFLVPANAEGVTARGYPTIDGLHAAEIAFEAVTLDGGALLGREGGAFPALEETLARGALALSAEAIGAMEVCRDITIEYLKTRRQFGVPIGKFQALQHRMATLLMEIEQARSSVINAAGCLNRSREERELAVSAAKAMTGRIGRMVAEEAIQMHGGIAMTWEYSLGHYAKRLVMIDHQFGDVDFHTARYAEIAAVAGV